MGYLERVSGTAKPENRSGGGDAQQSGKPQQGSIKFYVYVDPTSGKITEGKRFIANKPFWIYGKIGMISQPNVFVVDRIEIKPAGIYGFTKSEIINGKKYHQILA